MLINHIFRNLLSIMGIYFKSATGEISMCIAFGFFSFVAAMGALVIKETVLEFELNSAYESFVNNSVKLMPKISNEVKSGPVSLTVIKVCLAFISGVTGTLLVFPGMRIAQMYIDALKYTESKFKKLFLHISYFFPLIIVFMWIKPIARDILCYTETENIKRGFLTNDQFDMIRILCIIFLFILRIILARAHFQAYLNTAYLKINRMKKEAGYTTNTEIQTTISGVFYYLGIVALQYISPMILIGCTAMALKTMGGFSWKQILPSYSGTNHLINSTNVMDTPVANMRDSENFGDMVNQAGLTLAKLSAVFTPLVFRAILSFYIWWLCISMFVASSMGVIYHTYLVL